MKISCNINDLKLFLHDQIWYVQFTNTFFIYSYLETTLCFSWPAKSSLKDVPCRHLKYCLLFFFILMTAFAKLFSIIELLDVLIGRKF